MVFCTAFLRSMPIDVLVKSWSHFAVNTTFVPQVAQKKLFISIVNIILCLITFHLLTNHAFEKKPTLCTNFHAKKVDSRAKFSKEFTMKIGLREH